MLLVLGLLLILLFGGLGFVLKVFWWGLIIGVILMIAHLFSGDRYGRW